MSDARTGTPRLLRLTVDGPEPLVLELDALVDAGRPAASGPLPVDSLERIDWASRRGPARYEVVVDGWRFEVEVESVARARLRERASQAAQRGSGGGRQVVRAQIPGRIMAVGVRAGEVVEAGQRLLSVEAMKMENAVIAPWAGTIARVGVVAGQTVELGDELVVIE